MAVEAVHTTKLNTRMPDNLFPGRGRNGTDSSQGPSVAAPKGNSSNKVTISQAFMDAVNQDMQAMHNVGLEFSVHKKTGETVVKVVDRDTGKLIRQIPSQEMLDLADKLEAMMGILFDKKV
jgi:flagellar protein FlaG